MEIPKGEAAAAEAGVEVRAPSRFMRIGVFRGSSMGKKASYHDAELGQELVARNIDLVYGGGSLGLMGLVSRAVYSGGRHVVRVIPKALMPREITGEAMGEVKVVSNMHQRKAEMTRQSDAFIALPGGYGTVEELFEAITWAQLGIHDKPVVKGSYWSCHSSCPKMPLARARYQKAQTVTIGKCYCMPVGVLNVDGYYDALVSSIDTAVEEGFIQPSARHIIVPKELLDKLETYSPRHKEVAPKTKWELDRKVSCAEIPGDEDVVVSAQCGNML